MINIQVPNNLWFVNVGTPSKKKFDLYKKDPERNISSLRKWENSLQYGFISAGHHPKWSNQIKKVKAKDIVCAYVTEKGFVGIGECIGEAIPIKDFKIDNGELLSKQQLVITNIFKDCCYVNHPLNCEFAIGIKWFDELVFSLENAKSVTGKNLGITQAITSNLLLKTESARNKKKFIETEFTVKFIV